MRHVREVLARLIAHYRACLIFSGGRRSFSQKSMMNICIAHARCLTSLVEYASVVAVIKWIGYRRVVMAKGETIDGQWYEYVLALNEYDFEHLTEGQKKALFELLDRNIDNILKEFDII